MVDVTALQKENARLREALRIMHIQAKSFEDDIERLRVIFHQRNTEQIEASIESLNNKESV
jgi:hypothetical protein